MSSFTGLGLRLSALAAGVQFINGVHLPYFPLFLANRGFDAPTVGLLLAIPVFVRIVATPLVTSLGDRRAPPAILLTGLHVGLALLYFSMLFVEGFWSFVALGVIAGALHGGVVPLQDIVLMREIAVDRRLKYGRIRVWGTVSFMAASILVGAVIARQSPEAVVVVIALAALLVVPIALSQPRRFDASGERTGDPASGGRLITATTMLLIAGIALSHASHAGLNGFGTLSWERQGYGLDAIGRLWALAFLAEIIVFWIASTLVTRFEQALAMLAIGAGVALLRWLFMAMEPGAVASSFLQISHAVSFGFVHLAGIAAIGIVAPPGKRATLMGIAGGAGAAVSGFAMLASGRLYAVSPSMMFSAMAAIACVSLACYALIWLSRRG